MVALGDRVTVRVEVPRGGFVKRDGGGRVDFVSPLPCPFNYGCIPGTSAPDGEPLDALLLGPRRPVGHTTGSLVVGVVRFVDAGAVDLKYVCAEARLGPAERLVVRSFFLAYGLVKAGVHRLRGRRGRTAYEGLDVLGAAGEGR